MANEGPLFNTKTELDVKSGKLIGEISVNSTTQLDPNINMTELIREMMAAQQAVLDVAAQSGISADAVNLILDLSKMTQLLSRGIPTKKEMQGLGDTLQKIDAIYIFGVGAVLGAFLNVAQRGFRVNKVHTVSSATAAKSLITQGK